MSRFNTQLAAKGKIDLFEGAISIDSHIQSSWIGSPIYGIRESTLLWIRKHRQTYDVFRTFYANKYADHHAFEIHPFLQSLLI
jgi:hypothetical protein